MVGRGGRGSNVRAGNGVAVAVAVAVGVAARVPPEVEGVVPGPGAAGAEHAASANTTAMLAMAIQQSPAAVSCASLFCLIEHILPDLRAQVNPQPCGQDLRGLCPYSAKGRVLSIAAGSPMFRSTKTSEVWWHSRLTSRRDCL